MIRTINTFITFIKIIKFIRIIALTITRCTFQEYKMRYNINSDEFDDLDKGYECVYNPYHIIFIPDIMAIDMFDL